jgi:hypothetical protein
MAIVFVGHSHIGAITKGAALLEVPVNAVKLRESKKDTRSKEERFDALKDAVATHRPNQLICLIGGGMPAILGVAQHPVRFDFALPWRPDLPLDADGEIVPYDAMRALMEARVRKHLKILGRMRKFRIPMTQLETPPPIYDNKVLKRMSGRFFGEGKADGKEAAAGISNPYLRFKLWSLHSKVFEEFCADNKIRYVKSPAAAADEKGFLAREFWGDFVHANDKYGAMILRNVENA